MSTPTTMLEAFEPPEGLVGHSAILVAMTAEEEFLEEVMERFTGLRPGQRVQLGVISTYLMLDPHTSPGRTGVLPPGRIPGLHELTPRANVAASSLLHAKVALLGFSKSRTGKISVLRLIVLTANFTYASAKRQLELVWLVDLPVDESSPGEDRADVLSVAEFVSALAERRFYRDEESVPSKQRRLTARFDALLEIASSVKQPSVKARFIHSLETTLHDQIRARFRSAIDAPRNLLLCGSGFYEEPGAKPRKPAILTKLEDLGVFTSNAEFTALVEPKEGGAIATWAVAGPTDRWLIARPTDVEGLDRLLHAKFVYAGYLREGHLSNGWLYLGSGNLSRRGLLTSGAIPEGNVECGVVVPVAERLDLDEMVPGRLFWAQDAKAIKPNEWSVGRVGDAPEDTPMIVPAPILSASIGVDPPVLRFSWRDDVGDADRVSVSWSGVAWSQLAAHQPSRELVATEPMPVALRVRDDVTNQEWSVPVVDPSGRISWSAPTFDSFDDALAALLDFPIRPAEDATEDDDDADGDPTVTGGMPPGSKASESKSYALHAAASLIEQTAALQRALPVEMLDDWFDHIDRMFRAAFPDTLIATWRAHRINVFAHLRESDLRPQTMEDKQRKRYLDILDRATLAWGLA